MIRCLKLYLPFATDTDIFLYGRSSAKRQFANVEFSLKKKKITLVHGWKVSTLVEVSTFRSQPTGR